MAAAVPFPITWKTRMCVSTSKPSAEKMAPSRRCRRKCTQRQAATSRSWKTRSPMLTEEQNQFLTRVGPGTPMGELMRRYWIPALLSWELPEADCPPLTIKLLGEELVAFRDTSGKVGVVGARCAHRRAHLFWGRNEENGLRCVYHGWKFDCEGKCVDMPSEPAESNFKDKVRIPAYPTYEIGGLI